MSWIEFTIEVKTEDYSCYEMLLLEYVESVVVIDPKATLDCIEKGRWEAHGFSKEDLKQEKVKLSCYLEFSSNSDSIMEHLEKKIKELGKQRDETIFINITELSDVDWTKEWQKNYEILFFGEQIEIVPVWLEPTGQRKIVIKVDPGLAFGTGNHETTALPLSMLERYIKENMTVFDLGTGSGILAFAAKKLGAKTVIGYDYDPVAIRVAKEHAMINNLEVNFLKSNLFSEVNGKADFIIANIVTKVLLLLLEDLEGYLAPFGKALLSGISIDTLEAMKEAVDSYGFKILEEVQNGDWMALVLERKYEIS